MNYHLIGLVMSASMINSGCTPLGAVSMVGSAVSRTIEKEQAKKEAEPLNRRIAFSNVNLGVEYMRQGEYEKALEKFNKAVEADNKYPLSYNMLGVLYQQLNDAGTAEDYFKKSLKLAPEDPSALNNYGQFLCKQGREKEAEEKFLAAAANPFYQTPEIAYTNAGSCAYLHKHTADAVGYFEKSLAINPQVPVALSQMAEISYDRGDFNKARDFLGRYLELASHTPKTLWLGIRIERHFNDLDRVASYSLLLRNMYPDTVEAELLRISEDYVRTAKKNNPGQQLSITSVATKPAQQVALETSTVPDNSTGLLSGVDPLFHPLLLQEKDLLGLD